MSVKDITMEMRKLGLTSNMKKPKLVGHSTIASMFKNIFYYGMMAYRKKDYPYKYENLYHEEYLRQDPEY